MTNDNMPEPVAWLGTGGTIWLTYRTAVKHCAKPMPLHTADQLRAALAAQAEKHAAEIAELRDRPITDSTYLGLAEDIAALTAERGALRAEVEALRAALKPFADADLTLPTVRDTFGFDVLRARAALAAQAEKHAAERDALRAELAECKERRRETIAMAEQLRADVEALKIERDLNVRQCDAYRWDAERYRWLRACGQMLTISPSQLDSATDAARSGSGT